MKMASSTWSLITKTQAIWGELPDTRLVVLPVQHVVLLLALDLFIRLTPEMADRSSLHLEIR